VLERAPGDTTDCGFCCGHACARQIDSIMVHACAARWLIHLKRARSTPAVADLRRTQPIHLRPGACARGQTRNSPLCMPGPPARRAHRSRDEARNPGFIVLDQCGRLTAVLVGRRNQV
jgi:hypothetical protein